MKTSKLMNIAATLMILVLCTSRAQARFVDFGPDAKTGDKEVSWSWTAVKAAVVAKLKTFFNNDDSKLSRGSTTVASEAAPLANVQASASAPGHQGVPTEASMKTVAEKVKKIPVAHVAQPAVPFNDKNLIMGHHGVPVFEFKKYKTHFAMTHVKKVPLLDVGSEEILDPHAFDDFKVNALPLVRYELTEPLPEPHLASAAAVVEMQGKPLHPAGMIEQIPIPILEAEKKVTAEKIAQLVYKLAPEAPFEDLTVVKMSDDDLKLLRGLILFEKKDQCHIAAGIFSDLLTSEKPAVQLSSQFHLGVCLHEMNLPNEAIRQLSKVMKSKNSEFAKEAIKTALDDLQLQHEGELVEALNGVDESLIPKSDMGHVNYLRAKVAVKKGQAEKALELAGKVATADKFYYRAQYVAGVAEYLLGRLDASLSRQKSSAAELVQKGTEKDVLALFEMNIGRTAFQKAKYKDSLEAFQKVPKESVMWMQALQEEAWAQLQSKDAAGAIGNMHSIQSPYFDGVFKPESHVVRSIAYLTICQYPDAYKALSYLDQKYSPWLEKMDDYSKNHSSAQLYQTVLKQLQTKANQDADLLPFQVVREIAHQRDFINAQESVNQIIDETSGYSFIRGLIEKDRRSLMARRNATVVKVAELSAKLKRARTTPDAMKNFNAWKFELANNQDFLAVYEFKAKTMKEGLDGLNNFAPGAIERLNTRKGALKETAGKVLKEHLNTTIADLRQNLDNNELLKYEIYAGSGENLRYKMAGGKGMPDKKTVERKLAGMHWDFDGEFWEDEIGHYRSSLKNNCQNQVTAEKTR